MKLVLTGGGTGGHVYPALSVAEVLPARTGTAGLELLFVGTERGDVARLAAAAGLPFASVRAAPVRGKHPGDLLLAAWQLSAGTGQAERILSRFQPRAVLATGGYASIPIALAARLRRVPLVLYLPDVYPGWAVRVLAVLAQRIAVTSEGALAHLPRGKTMVTGYPVRPEFWLQDRAAARGALGFAAETPLLLVTGASQGSLALNAAVYQALPCLLARCAVLHQTGAANYGEAQAVAAALPAEQRDRYRPLPYLDDMPQAMAAADLAVMRAGASSLAEPPAAGLPTVLVPGRFAGAHQRHNARFMAARGAALDLPEERLSELAGVVLGLLADDDRRRTMAANARLLARPDAAAAIADVLLEAAA